MIAFDAFFRFSGISLLILLIVLIIRDLPRSKSSLYLMLSAVTVMCLFLGLAPDYYQLPAWLELIVRFADIPHLVFIWLFALSLFQQEFRFTKLHLAVLIIYSFPILVVRLGQFAITEQASFAWYLTASLFSASLMAHLIFVTLRDKKDDLINNRRSARNHFVFVIVFITLGVAFAETMLLKQNLALLYSVKIALMWIGIVWTSYWLFRLDGQSLNFFTRKANQGQLTDLELSLINKLEFELVNQKAYLNPKLSIEQLASSIGITSHKLRALINQKLKFDNFSSYINKYRIEAVKVVLDDPASRDIPILSIALNHGFNSISPFNKAFKNIENMTPSQYRKTNN